MERTALDTSVCIAMLKDALFAERIIERFADETPCIPSVVVFELSLRTFSLDKVKNFLSFAEILDLDEKAAHKSSQISKNLQAKGQMIGTNDIFIAATAMSNGCTLATLDMKDFSKIKGLKLAKVKQ